MLKLIKIFNSSILGYWYIPENRDPGMIEIDEQTGEVTVAIESNYDKELGAPIMQIRLVEQWSRCGIEENYQARNHLPGGNFKR